MVLIVTEKGRGKLVGPSEFTPRGRGGKGVTAFNVTDESGAVVAAEHIDPDRPGQDVIIFTAKGMAIRLHPDQLGQPRSRSAGGVRLMDVADGDRVVAVKV